MEKPMHFQCGEASHRMRIWRKRDIQTLWTVWIWIFQTLPVKWVLLHIFTTFFPCDDTYLGYHGSIHNLGKNMATNFPGSPHKMQFAAFSQVMEYLWEILWICCVMKYHGTGIWKKRHQYMAKSMGTGITSSLPWAGFAAFPEAMKNWWKDTYFYFPFDEIR